MKNDPDKNPYRFVFKDKNQFSGSGTVGSVPICFWSPGSGIYLYGSACRFFRKQAKNEEKSDYLLFSYFFMTFIFEE